jgi:hypothetical protein
MPDLITSHAWRPAPANARTSAQGPREDRPCEYAGCGRPRSEHERATAGDVGRAWGVEAVVTYPDDYLKCPVCFASLGTACMTLTGVSGRVFATNVPRGRPHSRRKLRAAAARAVGDRG